MNIGFKKSHWADEINYGLVFNIESPLRSACEVRFLPYKLSLQLQIHTDQSNHC